MEEFSIQPIAYIHSDFDEKFGIPRQSGLIDELEATIVFEPKYRNEEALRGIEGFSHLWLIWQFSRAVRKDWSPTVRPPRLGGNERMGVFATRSPFRPNALGLSAVRLKSVEHDPENGTVLRVCGADLLNGTPIFDIKPYVPYADCIPGALSGFAPAGWERRLEVAIADEIAQKIPNDKFAALKGVLAQDPRPSYQDDPDRVYGMTFAGMNVKFVVSDGILTVTEVN